MLRLRYTSAGISRRMDLLVDSLQDLNAVLKKFGVYLRQKAQYRFDEQGPGWDALAPATLKRREATAPEARVQFIRKAQATLRGKLQRDIRRAAKRQASGRGKEGTVERRQLVLAEFERQLGGGEREKTLLTKRLAESLAGRIGRATAKGEERAARREAGELLGRMASSITAQVGKGTLVVESTIAWSAVHNEGGTAGHGAAIPARTFLELEPDDMDVLVQMTLDHMLKKQDEAA